MRAQKSSLSRLLWLTMLLALFLSGCIGKTVSKATLLRVEVTPSDASLAIGTQQQYTATAIFTDSTRQDVSSGVTWSSLEPTVATISSSGLASAQDVGITTISATYQGQTGLASLTVTPAVITSLAVMPTAPSIAKGSSRQFSATATFSDNSTQDVTASAAWTSSDTGIATISNSTGSNGLASSVATGSTTIAASYMGETASTTLTVTAATVTSIAITPASPSIAKGTGRQFAATATFTDNSTQDVTTAATWTSSDTSVATISNDSGSNGLAQSLATGSTVISASYGAQSATTTLTVTPAAITGLAVTPTNPSIAKGTTQQFAATASFTDGSTQNVTTAAVWTSSDTAVATISNAAGSIGLAQGLAIGSTTISVDYMGQTGSTTLTVSAATLVSLAVTPASASVAKGLTQQFRATGTYSDQSTQDITNAVTWASSDTAVTTISNASGSNGLAQSVGTGSATITATASSISNTASLTVTAATLARIDITPPDSSIPKGLTQQFTATGVYTDNSTQDLSTTLTWASSDTNVAHVSNASGSQGLVAANNVGTATISAGNGSLSGSTPVTVTSATLTRIQVTPANPLLASGYKRQFTATGTFSDGSNRNITTSVTWSSTNPAFATISNAAGSNGLASGVAAGSTTISAVQGSVTGTTQLTVTNATLSALGVTPASPSIALGLSQQFTAVGTFSDSSTQDLTTQVTWASANTSTATISNASGSQGLATSAAQGSSAISATLNSVTGSTTLTVNGAALVSISVTPANPSVAKGLNQQFVATGTYTDGSTAAITTAVTWASSATSIATISNASGSQGLARGVAVGTATISAALQGKTGSTQLTVSAASLSSIDITPVNASVALGTSVQYAAMGNYSDGSMRTITTEVNWTSDNETVASISNAAGSAGKASTFAQGSANISATLGSVTSSTSLTVTGVALVSIAVTPANQTRAAGDKLQYTAVGTYSDSSTQDLTTQVTWSTSDASKVAISNASDSPGFASTLAPATVQISASFSSPTTSTVTGSTNLTVTAATLTSIVVAPASASVPVNFRRAYTATGNYSDGSTADLTTQVSWSTLNPAVATITSGASNGGVLSAVAAGSTNVIATLGSISSTTRVTVTTATLQGITVTPANATLRRGSTQQYQAVGTFSDSSTLSLTTQVTWASSNTNVATISNAAGSQGLATVTNLPLGSTTISATVAGVTGSTTGTGSLQQ